MTFILKQPEDGGDLELTCDNCGDVLFDVAHGVDFDNLVDAANSHECGPREKLRRRLLAYRAASNGDELADAVQELVDNADFWETIQ